MIRYVCGFLFNVGATDVALIRKNKPEWQNGFLNGIGGKVEPNEVVLHAMSREFEEETGVWIDRSQWQNAIHLVHEDQYEIYFFYAFSDKIWDVRTVEEEEVFIVPVCDIPIKKTVPNLNWLIPLCLDETIQKNLKIKDIRGN